MSGAHRLGAISAILRQLTRSVFVVPATSQFLFKHYDPKTKKVTWRSVHGSSFKTNGSGCKTNEFVRCLLACGSLLKI